MKIETICNRPLFEDELVYKRDFQEKGPSHWSIPMTFSAYEEGIRTGRLVLAPGAEVYREGSVDQLGTTIKPIENEYNVRISLHRRYSYPVLHNHSYIEIIYVAAGRCTNLFKLSSFPMGAGDVCIMSPHAFHALSCTNDESCIINIMVSPKFFDRNFLTVLKGGKVMSDFLERVLYRENVTPYILFRTGKDERLRNLGAHMLTESQNKPHAFEYALRLLTCEFLLHITREYAFDAIVPNWQSATQNGLIVAILGYLSVHYFRTSLSEVAAYFGYSEAHLSRLIHKNTGKTFGRIITQLQMENAEKLLLAGTMNLTEIAQEVGCYDSSHLSRKFKAYFGTAPSRYAKTVKDSD